MPLSRTCHVFAVSLTLYFSGSVCNRPIQFFCKRAPYEGKTFLTSASQWFCLPMSNPHVIKMELSFANLNLNFSFVFPEITMALLPALKIKITTSSGKYACRIYYQRGTSQVNIIKHAVINKRPKQFLQRKSYLVCSKHSVLLILISPVTSKSPFNFL